MVITEKRRSEILSKSRLSPKGKQRIKKKNKSSISTSVRGYNKLDVNKFFKDDILDLTIDVNGETDTYQVEISFSGAVELIKKGLKRGDDLDYRLIYQSLCTAFNNSDLFLRCNCPDSKYRMQYWQTKNSVIKGTPENRPSNETNPYDSLGNACKHQLLVISNLQWIQKVASVVKNYITYTQQHHKDAYEKILYPLLYGKEYSEEETLDQNDIGKHSDNRDDFGKFRRKDSEIKLNADILQDTNDNEEENNGLSQEER